MASNPATPSWQEYAAQAERFIVFAQLASKHAKEEKQKNPLNKENFETFEAVSISVHHGFAAELLIKGIRAKKKICIVRSHSLKQLLERTDFSDIYQCLEGRYKEKYHGHDRVRGFNSLLDQAKNLFEHGRYHFEPNKNQKQYVNADFTSFLVGELREVLRNSI